MINFDHVTILSTSCSGSTIDTDTGILSMVLLVNLSSLYETPYFIPGQVIKRNETIHNALHIDTELLAIAIPQCMTTRIHNSIRANACAQSVKQSAKPFHLTLTLRGLQLLAPSFTDYP